MKLLPEFRKASKLLNDKVKFGTIDCTVHQSLCTKFNVRSYPTTIFYNVSTPHPFVGRHYHKALIEFIEDVKNPSLISLDKQNFDDLVINRLSRSMWIVDFFNPHCFPCQQLAPEYRKLAKMMKEHESISFGQVDCLQERALCQTQRINGYPTIRLYPVNQQGHTDYNSWYRDAHSIRQWIYGWMPSSVVQISSWDFFDTVLYSDVPYLIDFYAPWCGHCHQFAPEYEKVAAVLKDRVNVVKIDCDSNVDACTSAGISGYPTLKFYAGVLSKLSSESTSKQHPFGEEISSQNAKFIISFVEKKLEKIYPRRKDEL
uniref:Thioredoxin domain-containing protein n=1 Tax=Romanomermis culicivorax TaxID=13658 RepID=A0A915HPB3_ROMCU